MNKLYEIRFCGHYPVGAIAIVNASSFEEADKLFLAQMEIEEPYILVDNTRNDKKGSYDICELNIDEQPCHILLNGEY